VRDNEPACRIAQPREQFNCSVERLTCLTVPECEQM